MRVAGTDQDVPDLYGRPVQHGRDLIAQHVQVWFGIQVLGQGRHAHYPMRVAGDDDDLIVEGYRFCRCGEWLPAYQAICAKCSADITSRADEALVVEVDGYPIQLKDKGRKKPKKRQQRHVDHTMTTRARDRARQRALFRLADIHRPLFEMLFIEEQFREGIDPAPPRSYKHSYTAQMVEAVLADIEDFRHRVESEVLGATSPGDEPYADPSA